MNRKIELSLAIGVIFLIPMYIQAQEPNLNLSEAADEAVGAVTSVAEMLISDSFTPMTGFDRGELNFIGSSALFEIEQAHEDPLVEGKDFQGLAVGGGAGYAFLDRWICYGILTGMKMEGDLNFQVYDAYSEETDTATDYTFLSLNGGLGYEVFDRSWISMPIFFGPHLQYYAGELVPDEIQGDIGGFTYNINSIIEGSGFLMGVSGGIAAYVELYGRLAFTTYLVGLASLNSPELEAKVDADGTVSYSHTQTVKSDPVYGLLFGLDLGYRNRKGWIFSFALGDLIAYLTGYGNTLTNEGVRMRPMIFVTKYSR